MEDVIFAGAATRPARNFAEVALHLDNSERTAPGGFNNEDNLEIVRRITREAGSAYKSNGRDVRARDVQMLFADASTGAHSPALVRQGQIAELINAKPKNRRRILEEAAGISTPGLIACSFSPIPVEISTPMCIPGDNANGYLGHLRFAGEYALRLVCGLLLPGIWKNVDIPEYDQFSR